MGETTPTPVLSPRLRRLGWAVLAMQIAGLLGAATVASRRTPIGHASADVLPDGSRMGIPLGERKRIFALLVAGEEADREGAEKHDEHLLWNRNRDSYFHLTEWRRLAVVCAENGLERWQGWLILDEGIRSRWPLPDGARLWADEPPLSPTTRPFRERKTLGGAR